MSMIMERPGQVVDATQWEKWVSALARGLRYTANEANDTVHDLVFALIAIVSPLPSAIGIYLALTHNQQHPAVAGTLAGAVEVGGIAAVWIALKIWIYNRSGDDVRLPQWMPAFLVTGYLLVVEGIVVSNEAGPALSRIVSGESPFLAEMSHLAPVLYPLMTAIGAIVVASKMVIDEHEERQRVRTAQHDELEAEREQMQLDAERERQRMAIDSERQQMQAAMEMQREQHAAKLEEKRLKLEAKLSQASVPRANSRTVPKTQNGTVAVEEQSPVERIMEHIRTHGDTGPTDIGRTLGIGRTTVYRSLEELENDGKLRKVPSEQPRREYEYKLDQKLTPLG